MFKIIGIVVSVLIVGFLALAVFCAFGLKDAAEEGDFYE